MKLLPWQTNVLNDYMKLTPMEPRKNGKRNDITIDGLNKLKLEQIRDKEMQDRFLRKTKRLGHSIASCEFGSTTAHMTLALRFAFSARFDLELLEDIEFLKASYPFTMVGEYSFVLHEENSEAKYYKTFITLKKMHEAFGPLEIDLSHSRNSMIVSFTV